MIGRKRGIVRFRLRLDSIFTNLFENAPSEHNSEVTRYKGSKPERKNLADCQLFVGISAAKATHVEYLAVA